MARIVVVGGGTGGHVTPIKYVAHAIKDIDASHHIAFISQRGDHFAPWLSEDEIIDETRYILAGKWRRYPNESFLTRLFDFKTHLLNARDVVYVGIGTMQAMWQLKRLKADVVLLKGGFVSVPVGLAAAALRVPFVTHDSDIIPGIANKVVARWAKKNIVGHPAGEYPYATEKMEVLGVPINPEFFTQVTQAEQNKIKQELKIPDNKTSLFVIGGSLGAMTINNAALGAAQQLGADSCFVTHLCGDGHIQSLQERVNEDISKNYRLLGSVHNSKEMLAYYRAADVVISRAGATSTFEIMALKKPSIIVPAAQLADQQKNVAYLKAKGAAIVLDDDELTAELLHKTVVGLAKDKEQQDALRQGMESLRFPEAAKNIARVLLNEVSRPIKR